VADIWKERLCSYPGRSGGYVVVDAISAQQPMQ